KSFNGQASWNQNSGFQSQLDMKFDRVKMLELLGESWDYLTDVAQGFTDSMMNAWDDVLNGVGYVFGCRDEESLLNDLFGHSDEYKMNKLEAIDKQIADIDKMLESSDLIADAKNSNKYNTTDKKALQAMKERYLQFRDQIEKNSYFGADEPSDDNLGWKRNSSLLFSNKEVAKDQTQFLPNGEKNEYEERNINGMKHFYVNGKELSHGDVIVTATNGKLTIVKKENIAEYIKENGITDAFVSVNGRKQDGMDAIKMAQSYALSVNEKSVQSGKPVMQFHIFNDEQISSEMDNGSDTGIIDGWIKDRDKPTVQKTLPSIIEAGAFSTGGTIVGHSAGGYNVAKTLENWDYQIEADVFTFGSVHGVSNSQVVNSWKDLYNPFDSYSSIGRDNLFSDPIVTGSAPLKYKILKNRENANWRYKPGVPMDTAPHLFIDSYWDGFNQFYQPNSNRKGASGGHSGLGWGKRYI
ncbi:MAG: hypothetical protein JJT78_06215, partial [Leptospira sp.]|nr:hypothetical protein [Leptospira sp.]